MKEWRYKNGKLPMGARPAGRYNQDLVIGPANYYHTGVYQCISELDNGSYLVSEAELEVICEFNKIK